MQFKSSDEWVFLEVCNEAMQRCGTNAARVCYVKDKLERISAFKRRKTKEKADSENRSVTLLEKHKAQHYGLSLPFDVLEEEVLRSVEFLAGLSPQEREFLLENRRLEDY